LALSAIQITDSTTPGNILLSRNLDSSAKDAARQRISTSTIAKQEWQRSLGFALLLMLIYLIFPGMRSNLGLTGLLSGMLRTSLSLRFSATLATQMSILL
jgi:hypothetical protein